MNSYRSASFLPAAAMLVLAACASGSAIVKTVQGRAIFVKAQ
jgi:hypothetical protein